ncbi:MAG: hypothetical protein SOR93_09300 [Clostridiales Family XIII bacterium]|nr:hypothetical protein [Clostridiales Family XIII bacterium]
MLKLIDILKFVGNALKVDYIVEEGTAGIWTYRKWNSGIAECWGIISSWFSCTIPGLGGYYHPQGIYVDMPIDLFNTTPVGTASIYGGGVACGIQVRAISKTQFYWNALSISNTGQTYTAHMHVKGRWK